MKRMTILLMSAGAFALAACSGGEEGGNDAAANTAGENAIADVMFDEANNLGNAAEAAPAGAEVEGNATAAAPAASSAPAPAASRPNAAPEEAPAPRPERPKVAPRPAPTPEPSPPPKAECLPEHRAAGHC